MKPSLLPLNSAISRFLVPLFIRARVSANAVTLLSLFSGVVAGLLFGQGTPRSLAVGGLAFLLANLLDECDGTVARITNSCSRLGGLLDTVTDCVVHAALFLGLGFGIQRISPHGPWLLLGISAASGSILSCAMDVGGITPWQAPKEMPKSGVASLAWMAEWLRIDFSLLVAVSAFLGQMGWILWAGALGVFLFWIPSTALIAVRQRKWNTRSTTLSSPGGMCDGSEKNGKTEVQYKPV